MAYCIKFSLMKIPTSLSVVLLADHQSPSSLLQNHPIMGGMFSSPAFSCAQVLSLESGHGQRGLPAILVRTSRRLSVRISISKK